MTVAEWLRRWLRKPVGDIEIAAAHSLNLIGRELMIASGRMGWETGEIPMRTGLTSDQHRKIVVDIQHADIMAVSILAESLGMRVYVAPINTHKEV